MSIISSYSKEELLNIVNDCTSFRELMRRLGYTATGDNLKTIKAYLEKSNISTEHFTNLPKHQIKRNVDNVFCENSSANQRILRIWYEKGNYSEYKCAICGMPPIWCGKELTLTLDHINGINNDNRLQNLRWVCPNCDRQLPTFAGKNIASHKNC